MLIWIPKTIGIIDDFSIVLYVADIEGGIITIEPRPAYCDRGRWIVKIFTDATDIDSQDGFPRYYFDLDRAKAEMEDFVKFRNVYKGSANE